MISATLGPADRARLLAAGSLVFGLAGAMGQLLTLSIPPGPNRTKIKNLQKTGAPFRCAIRVLRCEGKGYEDLETLHGRSHMCTRHGHLLCGWRRGDGFQRGRGVDPRDGTAGP